MNRLLWVALVTIALLAVCGCAAPVSSPPASAVPTASATSFGPGTYLAGTDIPAGEYKGTLTGTESAFWKVTGDANGEDFIAGDSPEGPFRVSVKAGQYLKVARATITLAP